VLAQSAQFVSPEPLVVRNPIVDLAQRSGVITGMRSQSGPWVYRNWLAMNESQPCGSTAEYPLFTDAHITG
jgi:hypothetical protein